jgi:hypothetical protein
MESRENFYLCRHNTDQCPLCRRIHLDWPSQDEQAMCDRCEITEAILNYHKRNRCTIRQAKRVFQIYLENKRNEEV